MRTEGVTIRLNRHDRKRGMQPSELTCQMCKSDLGIVGVTVIDSYNFLQGTLEPGEKGFIVRAIIAQGTMDVSCGECGARLEKVWVENWYPDSDYFQEELA